MSEISGGAAAAYALSGALMLTAAIGTWANPDPYAARMWMVRSASLGFAALGAGLVLGCVPQGGFCNTSTFARHVTLELGIANIGFWLTNFVLTLLAPVPSAGSLDLEIRDRPPAERNARVREFLERRERARRMGNYSTMPWALGLGITQLAIAHEAPTSGGRALAYGVGGLVLALTTGSCLYELLRETDVEQFEAGESP